MRVGIALWTLMGIVAAALYVMLLTKCSHHPKQRVVTPICCLGARPGHYVLREVFASNVPKRLRLDDDCFVGEPIAMDVAETE